MTFGIKTLSKIINLIVNVFLFGFSVIFTPLKQLLFNVLLQVYKLWRKYKKTIINIRQSNIWNTGAITPLILIIVLISYGYPYIKTKIWKEYDFNNIISILITQAKIDETMSFINKDEILTKEYTTSIEAPIIPENDNLNNYDNQNGIGGGDFPPTLISMNGAFIRPNITSDGDDNSILFSSHRKIIEKYTVKPGDTISSIAAKFGLKTQTVLWANDLSKYSIIKPGDTLRIPKTDGVIYKVKKGETLSSIAKKYKADVDKIKTVNNLVSANQINIGQEIVIPGAKPIVPKAVRSASIRRIFTPKQSNKPSPKGFIWPTPSRRITQYYSWRHKALDIAGPPSITLVASKEGVVEYAGWSRGYGLNVVINHGNGVMTRYAHMRKIWVKKGQRVKQGEGLGKKGSTGWSTGPHVHFEIMINSRRNKVNPLSYLP